MSDAESACALRVTSNPSSADAQRLCCSSTAAVTCSQVTGQSTRAPQTHASSAHPVRHTHLFRPSCPKQGPFHPITAFVHLHALLGGRAKVVLLFHGSGHLLPTWGLRLRISAFIYIYIHIHVYVCLYTYIYTIYVLLHPCNFTEKSLQPKPSSADAQRPCCSSTAAVT